MPEISQQYLINITAASKISKIKMKKNIPRNIPIYPRNIPDRKEKLTDISYRVSAEYAGNIA